MTSTEGAPSKADKRRARLAALLEPASTAVVTNEMQVGIIGPDVMLPALAEEVAAKGLIPAARRVIDAAHDHGIRVVHCTVEDRPDGAGGATNCSIFALAAKQKAEAGSGPTDVGTETVKLVPELGDDPRDILMPRMHGMTPMTGTSLDQVLRNLGVRTVVVMGVSVNLGVFGLCLSALDHGYQVVLVRDAVAGVPAAYGDAVIDNSLSLITTVTTSDELVEILATR
jgi:nicotinamidase-related amidase